MAAQPNRILRFFRRCAGRVVVQHHVCAWIRHFVIEIRLFESETQREDANEVSGERETGGPVGEAVGFERGEVGGTLPDILLAADPGLDFGRDGGEVFGGGIVLRGVAPAHAFFYVDAVGDADVGFLEAAPSVEVFRFVLGDELFQGGGLPEEAIVVKLSLVGYGDQAYVRACFLASAITLSGMPWFLM